MTSIGEKMVPFLFFAFIIGLIAVAFIDRGPDPLGDAINKQVVAGIKK